MFPIWINKAIELRKNGLSYAKIGKLLNTDRKKVSFYLQEKGYGPSKAYKKAKEFNQPNKKAINENVFEKIDTEEKAYWLGFMYADGCVNRTSNRIELSLKEEDYSHIVKFKNFLESEHIIGKKSKTIKDKTYISYRLGITNEKLKNDLIKHGCVPNKTKVLQFPKLNKKLVKHFIRGYLDGDGCITHQATSKMSLEILGTEEFLRAILDYYNFPNDKYIYTFKHSDIKRLILSGPKAFEVIDDLYKKSNIYLERKFNLYNKFAPLFRDK
ncbi:MAG: hypothetical protein RR406_00235 [Bacilli bacterium]